MNYYDDSGRYVILGEGSIDWLTITTYDGEQAKIVEEMLNREYGESYTTITKDGGYIGAKYADLVAWYAKRTKEATHFLLDASAYNSDKVVRHLMVEPGFNLSRWKTTRIDIQITLPKRKRRRSLNSIGTDLKNKKWGEVSNRRKIDVRVQSSETGDTIYIGSPQSEKMRRIYTKWLTDEDENPIEFERYEIQHRAKTAISVMNKITSEGVENLSSMIQRVIKGDASILPVGFIKLLAIDKFDPRAKGITISRAKSINKASDTTKWFRGLRYAFVKAMNQPEPNGLLCREIAFEALIISTTQDNLVNWTGWKLLSPLGEIVSIDRAWYDSE